MKKLYKNWWMHNLVGHPLMQILNSLGMTGLGKKAHDETLPVEEKPVD